MRQASACVFSPNPLSEGYLQDAAIELVLRPRMLPGQCDRCRRALRPCRGDGAALWRDRRPTVVISGDTTRSSLRKSTRGGWPATFPAPNSSGSSNMGHKPDWIAPDLVVAAIEKGAGRDIDLQRWHPSRGAGFGRCAWARSKPAPSERPPEAPAPEASRGGHPAEFRQDRLRCRPGPRIRHRRCAACWSRPACWLRSAARRP
jgi:hypothetical protein